MVIDLRCHRRIGLGEYADVFAANDRAYKIFRNGPEVPPRRTKEGRRRVFDCQCKAFQLAAVDPFLVRHIAEFHGVQVIHDVLNEDGNSLQSAYLLDCCYSVELFGSDDTEVKATDDTVRDHEHIEKARQRFREVGITTSDSSIFRYEDPDRFKFIDIEITDCH